MRFTKTKKGERHRLSQVRFRAESGYTNCTVTLAHFASKEREAGGQPTDNLPLETVAHIQSAGCKEQKQCVTQAHNSCWKFLLRSIMEHGEAERDFLFLGEDKDKQLTTLWRDAEVHGGNKPGTCLLPGMCFTFWKEGFYEARQRVTDTERTDL